jgi:hypothetical protein
VYDAEVEAISHFQRKGASLNIFRPLLSPSGQGWNISCLLRDREKERERGREREREGREGGREGREGGRDGERER